MRKAVELAVSTHNRRTVGCLAELTLVGRRRSQCSQLTVDGGMPAHQAGSRSDEDCYCVVNQGIRQGLVCDRITWNDGKSGALR
jgi:hypothetical protein